MVSRRRFMQAVPIALSAAGAAPWAGAGAGAVAAAAPSPEPVAVERLVALTGDNVPARMDDYPKRLLELLDGRSGANDFYLAEGAVAELETTFAALLGKEDAAFMPTGTLANQIAIRLLCGERRHLLLQRESHVYRDESDAVPILSGINPVPLDGGTGDALYQSIVDAFEQESEAPYPVEVGAISLESPVRRLDGSGIAYATVARISALAREKGAGLHLDGARLLLMCGEEGFDVRRYCACFDTVYVSLYKYLGAPFGAILAGDGATIAKARGLRHVFGGTLFHGWVAALPAAANLAGFEQRFAQARRQGEELLRLLAGIPGIRVQRVPNGSNVAFLQLDEQVGAGLGERLQKAGIVIGNVSEGRLRLSINETILRKPVAAIAAAFAP